MRNLTPQQLLLRGSSIVGLITLVLLLFLYFTDLIEGNIWLFIAVPIISSVTCFLVFRFLIKVFITERIRILYRSIRKGKFSASSPVELKMSEDLILNAELETKKWTDERIEEISKLKEQEEFRREFLGNLAHELKTPVFSIQGYILTLLEGGLEDESINRNFLERASKATDRMTDILKDLDEISKMEVDQIKLDYSDFDIVELVREVFDDLEIKAKKRSISLVFSKEFSSIMVHADKSKIGQVLINLINNSIAYGKKEGKTIVRFFILDGILTVEVSDNGLGIEPQHLPRLFERFYRVEKSRNRHEGGSGLGLAIVKHIIEAHGQTISVRSTPKVGSTFTFGLEMKHKK